MPFDLAQSGVAAVLGDGGEAIYSLNIVEVPFKRVDSEAVNALTFVAENLVDLGYRPRFALHIFFSKFYRLSGPRVLQDIGFVRFEWPPDLGDGVRFIQGILMRQRLCSCGVRVKVVLKKVGNAVRKVLQIRLMVIAEVFV